MGLLANKFMIEFDKYYRFCLRFLKENKCYHNFIYNLESQKNLRLEEYIKDYICSQRNFLMEAFTWFETIEGERYWTILHRKFLENYILEFT